MSILTIGIEPKQVAYLNKNRFQISVQLIPSSIVAGNTGLVYGKFGSAPKADINSGTWDFVLNPGAVDGSNLYESKDKAHVDKDLWLISDTANQQVNVVERDQ